MRIFKLKEFGRFARRQGLTDAALRKAITRLESGSIDANLGGGLVKQRVPRAGGGKSGGFRTVIAFRRGQFAVFLHGFGKNSKANLDDDELASLKKFATLILAMSDAEILEALAGGRWSEIKNED